MQPVIWFALGVVAVLGLVLLRDRVASFWAQSPTDYDTGEPLDLRRDLAGDILCDGIIYGPSGRVVSRFVGDFRARWVGNDGVMVENFRYDTGKTQRREWRLSLDETGKLSAWAGDILGKGKGWQKGSAVCLTYRIRLEQDAGGHVLTVRDWMYRAPNGTIVNRSQFRKYGIKVAELVATMRRKDM